MSFFSNLFVGKKKGDDKGLEWIQKPPYTGQRPLSLAEARSQLPTFNQSENIALERSQGKGLVGFQPEWYETRKRQGMGDLAEAYADTRKRLSGQASGQGLRGGIPVSIQREAAEDYGDTTADFLDRLSIADLEARREDINRATYEGLPGVTQLGAGIQQNRAGFDLNEYNATMPILYEYPQEENDGMGMFDIFGSLFGGQSNKKNAIGNSLFNRSIGNSGMGDYGTGGTAGGTGWLSPEQFMTLRRKE